MRKFHQKQILELLNTLSEAVAEIKRLLSRNKATDAIQLLADCQSVALEIGESIERLSGEGTQTVSLLEAFCDLLYEAGEAINRTDMSVNFVKKLQKHLIKIENSVTSELKPDKLEIAFFPYNVTMWDSLESIWLAAKDDPQCDAYVVPIPYYEKLPDGTFGLMHYDGEKYPDYVPVVDWKTYDVEARHPDIVYIHYAYDDQANNARIHNDFYSARLRQHCDLLVYVPYFVMPVDFVEEYCGYLPGVLNSHLVIVQSEAVRQSYIGHYERFDKKFGWNGRFGKAEEKFAALGSPKFDKVINSTREDYDLPSDWQRKIYKADGTRKRVIFYNTHMFTWINGGETYFKKIQSVFDIFRNRDDVVLWWRPHPNTELNFRVYRPEWLGAYNKVVSDFKSEGWGIYDDTPDLHRAIAWSDSYYGDASSVVELYKAAGKPVMMRNGAEFSSGEKDFNFVWGDICSKHIYYFSNLYNAVFRINKETLEGEFVFNVPEVSAAQIGPFEWIMRSVAIWESKVIFVRRKGNDDYFMTYDVVTNEFNTVHMSGNKHVFYGKNIAVGAPVFHALYLHNGKIFCSPCNCSSIAAIDILTEQATYYDDFADEINRLINPEKHIYNMFGRTIRINNKLYMPCVPFNAVLVFDLDTGTSEIKTLSGVPHGVSWMQFDGTSFWLMHSEKQEIIIKWDERTGVVNTYNRDPNDCKQHKFRNFIYFNGYIFCATVGSDKRPMKIDVSNGEISIASELSRIIPKEEYIVDIGVFDNKLLFSASNGKAYELRDLNGEYRCCDLFPTNNEKRSIQDFLISQFVDSIDNTCTDSVYESPMLKLTDFLELLLKGDIRNRDGKNEDSYSVGQSIYANAVKRMRE